MIEESGLIDDVLRHVYMIKVLVNTLLRTFVIPKLIGVILRAGTGI